MKSFIIAILVLAFVVIFVVSNSIYVTHIYNDILSDTKKLPSSVYDETAFSATADLCTKVDKKAFYLFMTLPHRDVSELLHCYSDILSAVATQDENGYKLSVTKAELVLELMKRDEGLSFFDADKSKKRYFPQVVRKISPNSNWLNHIAHKVQDLSFLKIKEC